MADHISKLAPPPHYWDQDKIARYRDEAYVTHRALHGASDFLSQRLEAKINGYNEFCQKANKQHV